jgi:uncharacterized damage-inducible protein DinB
MSRNTEVLAAFDDTWSHKWESFEFVLNGITEEEAKYHHVAYAGEPPEEVHPPAGTIHWHLTHLRQCYWFYTDAIRQRPNEPKPVYPPETHSLTEAIEMLKESRDKFRATIASLTDADLEDPLCRGETVAEFIRASVRHDAWHCGQIAMVKRLARNQEGVGGGDPQSCVNKK